MKIGIIRGDFAAPGELPNFFPLTKKNQVTLFTGLKPVWSLGDTKEIKVQKLLSPVDLNFGKIKRPVMALTNRMFTDAHVLFGLEDQLSGFDVAHVAETYYSYVQQSIKAKKMGHVKKVVSTVWENISFNNEGIIGRKEFKQNAFQNVDHFLAVTQKARQVLIDEGCDRKKIEVLMPGVDLSFFKKHEISKFSGLQKDENIKLLFSGRLIKEKGILEIISMFGELQKEITQIQLIIAGDGPLKTEIENLIINQKLENIILLGKVNFFDMPKIYSLCDLLVHFPVGSDSWKEQYGMVLIEAMSCGLPVVGLDNGSVLEVVSDGGVVVSKEKYFENLLKLIKDKKKMKLLSYSALNLAKRKYDANKYAAALERIYSN